MMLHGVFVSASETVEGVNRLVRDVYVKWGIYASISYIIE